MRIIIIFLILFTCNASVLLAQDTLPKLSVTNVSNNILVSWTNPYIYLTNINIQRSFDSTKNFKTIGSILDVKNKQNGFVDTKPKFTDMFYRVFLSFEGGSYIFTRSYRPIKDTLRTMPDMNAFKQSEVMTWFTPSGRVYTGKDNNVIISLPNATTKNYDIKFFEENGNLVFEIQKIKEPYLTLEKVNFLHAGIFDFELFEEGKLIERHKVYIPKDVRMK